MISTNITPHDSSFVNAGKQSDKCSKFIEVQTRQFTKYLVDNVATCSMVSKATGIPQKNLTRYKRDLEDAGKLIELFRARCKHTGFPASYLTCNLELIEKAKKITDSGETSK
jgi:hypothetical protein